MSVELKDIIKEENIVYKKTPVLTDNVMHYCPGCSHGVVHKIIAEVIEEMGIQDKTIGVSPVGCSVLAYNYLDIDWAEAAHGRAPAVATGISRIHPDRYVFTYQGDGDLASIGCGEIMHACNRGENIVVIFINNAIYGMTGGQMAPTTLLGQVTATTPYGRDAKLNGFPMKLTELLAQLDGTCYVTRQSVHTPAQIFLLQANCVHPVLGLTISKQKLLQLPQQTQPQSKVIFLFFLPVFYFSLYLKPFPYQTLQ